MADGLHLRVFVQGLLLQGRARRTQREGDRAAMARLVHGAQAELHVVLGYVERDRGDVNDAFDQMSALTAGGGQKDTAAGGAGTIGCARAGPLDKSISHSATRRCMESSYVRTVKPGASPRSATVMKLV
jgi:hypothetical protein